MKDIGIGVIGANMGMTLSAINANPDSRLEVRAVCAKRAERASAAAAQCGIAFATDDYRTLIEHPGVDVVAIFSPDHLHAEHARTALQAGKHVICSKPMATSLADAVELVSLVHKMRLTFMMFQTMRFEPQFASAKRFLDDGDLGNITWAEAHYVHDMRPVLALTPWRLTVPQDLMYGGAIHPIDILRWLFGRVVSLHALGRRGTLVAEYPMPDNFIINLEFETGVIARVLASFGVVHPPMPMMGLGIYGDKGSLYADYTDGRGGSARLVLDKVESLPVAAMNFPGETSGAYGHQETAQRILKSFEPYLTQGTEPVPSVIDGARSVATAAAAWQSIAERRVVEVFDAF